eukprot:XP_001689418.1 predicted protein [Chlamydomonas reinhardtii]
MPDRSAAKVTWRRAAGGLQRMVKMGGPRGAGQVCRSRAVTSHHPQHLRWSTHESAGRNVVSTHGVILTVILYWVLGATVCCPLCWCSLAAQPRGSVDRMTERCIRRTQQ